MTTFAEQQGPCWATTYNRAACQWWWRSCSSWLLNIVGRIRGELHGLMAVPTSSLISAGPRTRSNHRYKFKYTFRHPQLYTEILFTSEKFLVERPWQRNRRGDYHRMLQESPALVRRPAVIDLIPHIGGLSSCRLRSRSSSRSWHDSFSSCQQSTPGKNWVPAYSDKSLW